MKATMTTPCDSCPFLKKMAHGFTINRLTELALSPGFPCHKTCDVDEDNEDSTGDFIANVKSVECAGAKIFLAKRKDKYCYGFDDTKLNMKAPVR